MKRAVSILIFVISAASSHAQIDVDYYLNAVMEYSHQLAAAEAATEGADADMLRARKGYLPSLDMGRDVDYSFRKRNGERRLGWTMRADVSQALFDGGSVRAAVKQAEARYGVREGEERSAMLDVEYEAVACYWSLSRADIYLQAMSYYRDIIVSLRDVVKRRYDEGYTSKSDLLQVESRLSDAEYLYSSAEQQRLVALHAFNTLCGQNPTREVVLMESILDTMCRPQREVFDDVVARHPDYAVSLAESEYARWGVKAARAEFLPSINIGVYGLWQPNSPNVKGAGTRLDGGVALSFHTPIFHFGERSVALRSARSAQQVAAIGVESVLDRLSLEESDGWTNILSTEARVEAARRNLSLARENLEISTYSYHEGLATILDVLQAQLSWLQIYENAIAAHYDYALAIAAYRRITAVEWQMR